MQNQFFIVTLTFFVKRFFPLELKACKDGCVCPPELKVCKTGDLVRELNVCKEGGVPRELIVCKEGDVPR